MKRTSFALSLLLLLFAGGVVGEETEPKCEEPFVYDEVLGTCFALPSAIFPKDINEQKPSSTFGQSIILYSPEDDGDGWVGPIEGCFHHGRAWFVFHLNEERKIVDITHNPDFRTICMSKEGFNKCNAERMEWDISLVAKEEICVGR